MPDVMPCVWYIAHKISLATLVLKRPRAKTIQEKGSDPSGRFLLMIPCIRSSYPVKSGVVDPDGSS